MKRFATILGAGVALAILSGCAYDDGYYGYNDGYYRGSYYGDNYRYRDRYAYDRYGYRDYDRDDDHYRR